MIPRFNVADYQSLLSTDTSARSQPVAAVATATAKTKAKAEQPSGASGRNLLFEILSHSVFFDFYRLSFGIFW